MKTKIDINIDSELLELAKETIEDFNAELDSMVQNMLANVLGVKQIWVKADTNEPVISKPTNSIKTTEPIIFAETSNLKTQKPKRKPKFILKIWDKVKQFLDDEFTIDDYWDATKKAGLEYKDSARRSTIIYHLKFLEETKIIIKIEEKPDKYRKLEEVSAIESDKRSEIIEGS